MSTLAGESTVKENLYLESLASDKRSLFVTLFEQELVREFSFLADCAAGRAKPKDTFVNKLLGILTTGTNSIPLIGQYVSRLVEGAEVVANRLKNNSIQKTVNMLAGIDLTYIQILAHLVAHEALYRYEWIIMEEISNNNQDGIIPLVRVGVSRILEKLVRTVEKDNNQKPTGKLTLNEASLLSGLIEGRSGQWVNGWSNTKIKKQTSHNTLFGMKQDEISAECVYARSGFRYLTIKSGKLEDLFYIRETPAHRDFLSKNKQTQNKLRVLAKSDTDILYNFGYTKMEEKNYHPKAGFAIMPLNTITERYDYHSIQVNTLSPEYQKKLLKGLEGKDSDDDAFISRISTDDSTFQYFLNWNKDPKHTNGTIVEYLKQQTNIKSIKSVQYFTQAIISGIEGCNLSRMDLSGNTITGSISKTSFEKSYLVGTKFENITEAVETNFRQAYAPFVDCRGIVFCRANFIQANFSYGNFSDCTIIGKTNGTIWYETILNNVKDEIDLLAIQQHQITNIKTTNEETITVYRAFESELANQANKFEGFQQEVQNILTQQNKSNLDKIHEEVNQYIQSLLVTLPENKDGSIVETRLKQVQQQINSQYQELTQANEVNNLAKFEAFINTTIYTELGAIEEKDDDNIAAIDARDASHKQILEQFQIKMSSIIKMVSEDNKKIGFLTEKLNVLVAQQQSAATFEIYCKTQFTRYNALLATEEKTRSALGESHGSELKKLKTQCETIAAELTQIQNNHQKNQSQLELSFKSEFQSAIAELNKNQKKESDELIKLLESKEKTLNSKIHAVNTELHERYCVLESTTKLQLDAFNKRIDDMEDKIVQMDGKLAQYRDDIQKIKEDVAQNPAMISRLLAIETILPQLYAKQQAQEELSQNIMIAKMDIEAAREQADNVKVAQIEKILKSQQDKIRQLEQEADKPKAELQQQLELAVNIGGNSEAVKALNQLKAAFVHTQKNRLEELTKPKMYEGERPKLKQKLYIGLNSIFYEGEIGTKHVLVKIPKPPNKGLNESDYITAQNESRDDYLRQAQVFNQIGQCGEIIQCSGIYLLNNIPHIILANMKNGTLYNQLITQRKSFTFPQLLSIAIDLAKGLLHMHNKGLYHRNIRLRKILITDEFDGCRLSGIGRSKALYNNNNNNNNNSNNNDNKSAIASLSTNKPTFNRLGSIPVSERTAQNIIDRDEIIYLSPECWQGSSHYTNKSEIFSYGMVLLALITGKEPYGNKTIEQIIKLKKNGEYSATQEIPSNIPDPFKHIINNCLNEDCNIRDNLEEHINTLLHCYQHPEIYRRLTQENMTSDELKSPHYHSYPLYPNSQNVCNQYCNSSGHHTCNQFCLHPTAIPSNIVKPSKQVNTDQDKARIQELKATSEELLKVGEDYESKKDWKNAFLFYEKAAKTNNTKARTKSAYCYMKGLGVNKDKQKAAELLRISALEGEIRAQYWLAMMIEISRPKESLQWYWKASEQGHEESKKRYAILSAQIATQQQAGKKTQT